MPTPALTGEAWERDLRELDRGVWLRRDALAEGMDDRTVDALVRSGEWARVRWGCYTAGETWRTASPERRHLLRAMAVARRAECRFALSHLTSVLMQGGAVWGVTLDQVHFTRLDRRAGRRQADVVQHRGLLEDEPVLVGGLPVTPPARAVAEAMTLPGVDAERGLVMANSLLHRGAMTKTELRTAFDSILRWPGSMSRHTVVELTDERIESVGESRTVMLLVTRGFGMPELQVEVCDAGGRMLGRVDFYLPALDLFLEFDGLAKYDVHRRPGETVAQAVQREKQRDDDLFRAPGVPIVHVGWKDLSHPDRLEAELRARSRRSA